MQPGTWRGTGGSACQEQGHGTSDPFPGGSAVPWLWETGVGEGQDSVTQNQRGDLLCEAGGVKGRIKKNFELKLAEI